MMMMVAVVVIHEWVRWDLPIWEFVAQLHSAYGRKLGLNRYGRRHLGYSLNIRSKNLAEMLSSIEKFVSLQDLDVGRNQLNWLPVGIPMRASCVSSGIRGPGTEVPLAYHSSAALLAEAAST